MQKTDTKITRFEYGDYYVDIVETEEDFEAWLQEKTCGNSCLMFGSVKLNRSFDEFVKMVEDDLDEYIKAYDNEAF